MNDVEERLVTYLARRAELVELVRPSVDDLTSGLRPFAGARGPDAGSTGRARIALLVAGLVLLAGVAAIVVRSRHDESPTAAVAEDPFGNEFDELLEESLLYFPGVHRGMSCDEMNAAAENGSIAPNWMRQGPGGPRPPLVPMGFWADGEQGDCTVIGWVAVEAIHGTIPSGSSIEDYALYDDDGEVLAHLPLPAELPPELRP